MGLFDSLIFKVGADTSDFDRAMSGVTGKTRRMAQSVGSALKVVGGAAVATAGAMTAIGAAALQTGAEFESLEARLSTLLGSAVAGRQRMEELFDVASSTPFNLAELVEAEAIMESFGVNAEQNRGAVMDLSGALGLSLTESAAAVGRAFAGGAGAADILRERGVLAMMELRTGIKATEMGAAEFREELINTLTDPEGRIAGGTARLAATFKGTLSNLEDELTRFRKSIADAGLFDGIKQGAREFLAIIDENRATVDALADSLGFGMLAAVQMTVRGVGYLAEGVNMVRLAWAFVEEAVFKVAGSATRFVESQIRDFEGLFDLLRRGAEAVGLDGLAERFRSAQSGFKGAADAVAGSAAGMEQDAAQARGEIEALTDSVGDYLAEANRLVAASNRRKGGTFGPPDAGAASSATPQAAVDAEKLAKLERQRLDLMRQQREMVYGLTSERLTAVERVAHAEMLAQERLQQITEDRLKLAKNDADQRLEIVRQFEADRAVLQEEFRLRSAEAARADLKKQRDEMLKTWQTAASTGATFFGGVSDAARVAAEQAADGNAKQAKALFAFYKAASISQALINQSLAVTRAFAELGPIGGAIAATGLGLTLGAQIATIRAQQIPSFGDTPGAIQAASGGLTANFAPRDYVIAAQNPRELQRQANDAAGASARERSRSGDSRPIVVNVTQQYQHHIVGRVLRDEVRRGGALTDSLQRAQNRPKVGARGY